MCRINIILSDIPELLEVCVAGPMIQTCQRKRTHQSNSQRSSAFQSWDCVCIQTICVCMCDGVVGDCVSLTTYSYCYNACSNCIPYYFASRNLPFWVWVSSCVTRITIAECNPVHVERDWFTCLKLRKLGESRHLARFKMICSVTTLDKESHSTTDAGFPKKRVLHKWCVVYLLFFSHREHRCTVSWSKSVLVDLGTAWWW